MRLIFLTLLGFLLVMHPVQAQQNALPSLNVEEAQKKEEAKDIAVPSFPKIVFGEENKYFTDITKVQYQISLLKVLIERQKKNRDIKLAFDSIGVMYKEPPPPRGTCVELPKNKLCSRFYPDMYGTIFVPRLEKASTSNASEKNFQDVIKERTLPVEPIVYQKPQTFEKKSKQLYSWSDISCIQDECRAVLVKQGRSNARSTIIEGDILPNDMRVISVSSNGVIVLDGNGKEIKLPPAPSSVKGGVSSPYFSGLSVNEPSASSGSSSSLDDMLSDLSSGDEIKVIE